MTQDNKQPAKQAKITFSDFDKLNLQAFGENLFQVIEKGLASSIGEMGEKKGWTISLNASFGNGKTTFLKMFEHFIQTEKKESYDVLFINAWESDFCEKPIIAILSEFANWLEEKKDQNETYKKVKQITGLIAKITKTAGLAVNQLIQYDTGLDIKLLTKTCFSKNEVDRNSELEKLGGNIIKDFNQRKTAVQQVRDTISKYIKKSEKKSEKKLLVIVDELDRTRPDYAVRFLEDMKHFFDIENVAFVVAVNRQQMEATVKCLYGQRLDFNGYYRKFFKQEMNLPDPYKEAQNFIDGLIEETAEDGSNSMKKEQRDHRVKSSYLSCKMFNLTLREIESFVRIFEMILEHEDQIIKKWIYLDAYSFFICLALKEGSLFQEILNKKYGLDDFLNFAAKKKGDSGENYLLEKIVCSFFPLESDPQDTEQIKQKNSISKHFPFMRNTDSLRHHYHHGNLKLDCGQPAVHICKRINQFQSALT